ncbi:CocE/NonD family hydrolase [Flindersiella endophytica]
MAPRVVCLDTEVVLPDGVRLATDVFMPDDGHRHPVLLVRTPYGRGGARGAYDAAGMARLGWAVVVQDVRGRWDSEGEFMPFDNEADDGAATIAWCVAQPWANGKVAMIGASYLGFVQWLAASRKPAGLVAIAPTVTAANLRDEVTFEGGALTLGTISGWAVGVSALGSNLDAGLQQESLQALDGWPGLLASPLEETVLSRITSSGLDWIDYHNTERWDRIDVSPSLGDLDLAGYHLAGWHDIFCEGNLNAFAALTSSERPESVRRRQRLVVGPWAHVTMLRRVTGELDFGVQAAGDFNGVVEEQIAFLTAAVAGAPELPSGVRLFVMGDDKWLDFDAWPVPTSPVSLYLAEDSRLTQAPAETAGADRWQHDPGSPVPNAGGRTLHPIPPAPGPLDQRAVESRADVLVYTSDVLEHDLTIIGGVRAELYFESTAPTADVTVKLVDVHPDERAMLVVDSIRRVSGADAGATPVEVEVGSTALTFKAGHRVRIEVASSNFPKYDLSPKADQTVHHGGRAPSRIVLPVFER